MTYNTDMNPLPVTTTQPSPAPPLVPADEGPSLADLFAPPAKEPSTSTSTSTSTAAEDPETRTRVEKVLEELRPYINADGGDIRLVSVVDGIVKVSMHGACSGCSSSLYTLQLGVERKLREEIPGIKYVEAV